MDRRLSGGIVIGVLLGIMLSLILILQIGDLGRAVSGGDEFTVGDDQLVRISVQEGVMMVSNGDPRYTDSIDANCLDQNLPRKLDVTEDMQDGRRTIYVESQYESPVTFARWKLTDCVDDAVDPYAPWIVNHPEITVYSVSRSEVLRSE